MHLALTVLHILSGSCSFSLELYFLLIVICWVLSQDICGLQLELRILVCPRPPVSAITGDGSKIRHQLYWALGNDDKDCDVENAQGVQVGVKWKYLSSGESPAFLNILPRPCYYTWTKPFVSCLGLSGSDLS